MFLTTGARVAPSLLGCFMVAFFVTRTHCHRTKIVLEAGSDRALGRHVSGRNIVSGPSWRAHVAGYDEAQANTVLGSGGQAGNDSSTKMPDDVEILGSKTGARAREAGHFEAEVGTVLGSGAQAQNYASNKMPGPAEMLAITASDPWSRFSDKLRVGFALLEESVAQIRQGQDAVVGDGSTAAWAAEHRLGRLPGPQPSFLQMGAKERAGSVGFIAGFIAVFLGCCCCIATVVSSYREEEAKLDEKAEGELEIGKKKKSSLPKLKGFSVPTRLRPSLRNARAKLLSKFQPAGKTTSPEEASDSDDEEESGSSNPYLASTKSSSNRDLSLLATPRSGRSRLFQSKRRSISAPAIGRKTVH